MEIDSAERSDCPYCGSTLIDGESPDPDVGGRKVKCEECGRYWDEGFVFTTVFIPKEYEKVYLERKFIVDHCTCASKPDEFCEIHSPEINC